MASLDLSQEEPVDEDLVTWITVGDLPDCYNRMALPAALSARNLRHSLLTWLGLPQ